MMESYYRPGFSLYLLIITIIAMIHETTSFQCYVCDSKSDVECMEKLPGDTRLKPQDCSNITDAKYCVKTTNIYAGEFGTKRFCAAIDHGNYCKYIRQPTGDRDYRSCVLTCDNENCNGATALVDNLSFMKSLSIMLLTMTSVLFLY